MGNILIFLFLFFNVINDGYKVGDHADDFYLENVDGNFVSLSDYSDAQGFIIVFTCNTCPYSIAYEDRLIDLDKKYKIKGYPVIAINPNDPKAIDGDDLESMKTRHKNKGFSFPYLQDKNQKIYPKFGATRTPHVYILEKVSEGNIVRYIGAIDDSSRNPEKVRTKYVEDAVDSLLEGFLPKNNSTKAIGCSIKTL